VSGAIRLVALALTVAATAGHAPAASFDCAKARSWPERRICADMLLSEEDERLGTLYRRVRKIAPDPAAFEAETRAEWRRREETCRDDACLRAWYRDRRETLTARLLSADPDACIDQGDSRWVSGRIERVRFTLEPRGEVASVLVLRLDPPVCLVTGYDEQPQVPVMVGRLQITDYDRSFDLDRLGARVGEPVAMYGALLQSQPSQYYTEDQCIDPAVVR
jgi:uncharacterized protein YecT (DUF1311 family)